MTLSPITKRRLNQFKANKRGYWSLWLFLILFVVTLFAEFVANDKPLYIRFNNDNYFPPKEGYDFSKITPTQLLEFLQRKPEQDPIMQDLQRSL